MGKHIIRISLTRSYCGEELEEFIRSGICKICDDIYKFLSQYEARSLFLLWLDFYRGIEEFCNFQYELKYPSSGSFWTARLSDEEDMECQSKIISDIFGEAVAGRFKETVNRLALVRYVDSEFYLSDQPTLDTLLKYAMTRRFHFLTMLYLITKYSKGKKSISSLCDFIPFFKIIESRFRTLVTGYNSLIVKKCISDYKGIVPLSGGTMMFNYDYNQLDDSGMEPIRLSQLDLLSFDKELEHYIFKKDKPCLYSEEELNMMFEVDAIVFRKFNIAQTEVFISLKNLKDDLKSAFVDGYLIKLDSDRYKALCCKYPNFSLCKDYDDFFDIQQMRSLFCKFDDCYYSSYYLFIRFYQNMLYNELEKIRKYRIISGFVFENKVIKKVERYGYKYHPECKRIKRKEFDVVCTKGSTIYNFQCKNNYLDVTQIDTNCVDKIADRHKQLERYYKGALSKEKKREQLLIDKLGITDVKHFVISMFPVITRNPNIIPFNQLERRIREGL